MFEWLRRLGSAPAAPPKMEVRASAPATVPGLRFFAGAQLNRFVDFQATLEVAHKERLRDLKNLRGHSRDLTKNNAFMKRYVEMVGMHVIGPEGISFESEIMGNKDKPKEDWNDAIEEAWEDWGRACTADGLLTWLEFQDLVARTVAMDGEALVHIVRGYPNDYGFALELIDPDRLDHTYSQAAGPDGSRIVMGVEMDGWGRPVAYHIWSAHPTDYAARPTRMRVLASRILHVYRKDRPQDVRGIPWSTSVMVQLNMLGRYWTAELSAANAEADRLGVVKSQQGLNPDDLNANPADTANELQSDHCSFIGLEPGQDMIFPQVQHPTGAFGDFTKALLKGISSGLSVAYHSLSGDVADANYSASRVALLDERDSWRKVQSWFISSACDPIFRAWLEMAHAKGAIQIPVADFKKVCKPRWWPRTWDWIDPEKDVKAAILAINSGLSTYQQELGARGYDWRDVFNQRKTERGFEQECGLDLNPVKAPTPQSPPTDEDSNDKAA